ncbi:tripartite tricarboxylate transporter substrate binding protein [Pseudacidovorax sp. RU35E]|uniref:Bug family tripartite tricarboxylate transporter substrate binding protein n=1 Tax=Pseudacidovorax sp. RU35E TaxID=1907403 RepID=UPI000954189A|nr:tripartite tricarboxylate transporter substrate binding protein [Pseudacidovorax sp. RU35E]SIR76089.1 Tripartite-type tricarboxylate transporter, receptor component TctC [Pseudacidovorax sp. RU35E]
MDQGKRCFMSFLGAFPLLGVGAAFADQFPSRPIKIIVPASAGTSIDAITRFFSDPLSKRLNTPVVVENRPGAGGLIAYQAAARAPADGYTLILTGIPLYLLPLFSDITPPPLDPVKDFAPVARVARVPFAIVVPADSPYQNMPDLIAAMKKNPNTLTYSSQGVGSSAHLCSVILNDMSKTQAQHISYKETTVAVTDVVGGRVSFTCQTSTGVLPLVQSGKLRALAVTGSKRWDALPNTPTVSEAGVSGFEVSSQLDFMAPSGTPQPIIRVLSQQIGEIAQTSEFKQFCEKQVLTQETVEADALRPEIVREVARWKDVARLARTN